MERTRRTFSAEEKGRLVKELLLNSKSVSELAEENSIHPNILLSWKKECLENLDTVFVRRRPDITEKAQKDKIASFEAKLQHKDAVIADLASEIMKLKKNYTGLD